jgi:hypothetical protein
MDSPQSRTATVRAVSPRRWTRPAAYGVIAAVLIGVGIGWPERQRSVSWRYFNEAAKLLFSRDGLHLFATHPDLQFGPVAALVGKLAILAIPNGTATFMAWVIAATMIPLLYLAERVAIGFGAPAERVRVTVFVGGLLLVLPWAELAFATTHLDDALALITTVVAMWAVERRRPVLAAVMLAIAVDSKPWALAFLPLLLVFVGRDRFRAFGIYVVLLLAGWLPFVIADPKTLNASKFTIANSAASSLRWLGVSNPRTPSWDRAAQIIVGGGAALGATLRRQWPSVMLAAISVRILIDPSTRLYYSAGLVLGAVIFDAAVARWRVPWASVITFAFTVIPGFYESQIPASVRGGARLIGTVIPLVFVAWFAWQGVPGEDASGAAAPFGVALGDQRR